MICASCGEQAAGAPCSSCGESPLLDDRFRLVEQLGHGAHGRTWRAEVVEGGAACAVKELPVGPGIGLRQRELFRREARVLGELVHEAVPELIDAVETGSGWAKTLWIVQELIPGPTLAQEMVERRYSEADVLDLLDELLALLAWLHERSPPVLHRDIKPSNIIRRATDGRLVLIDFGSVRDALVDPDLGGSTVTGTFGYMAPEQYAGDATERSDLYGLAATAVTLLTRRPAPELAKGPGVLAWRPHAEVTEPVAAVLDTMLALDPEARPASATQARAQLRAARRLGQTSAPVRSRSELVEPPSSLPQTAPSTSVSVPSDLTTWQHIRRSGVARGAFEPAHAERVIRHVTELQGRLRQHRGVWRYQSGPSSGRELLEISLEPGVGGTRVSVTDRVGTRQLRTSMLLGLGALFLLTAAIGLALVTPLLGTLLAILIAVLALPGAAVFAGLLVTAWMWNRRRAIARVDQAIDGILEQLDRPEAGVREETNAPDPVFDDYEVDHDFDDDWDEEVPREGLGERVVRLRRKERG